MQEQESEKGTSATHNKKVVVNVVGMHCLGMRRPYPRSHFFLSSCLLHLFSSITADAYAAEMMPQSAGSMAQTIPGVGNRHHPYRRPSQSDAAPAQPGAIPALSSGGQVNNGTRREKKRKKEEKKEKRIKKRRKTEGGGIRPRRSKEKLILTNVSSTFAPFFRLSFFSSSSSSSLSPSLSLSLSFSQYFDPSLGWPP